MNDYFEVINRLDQLTVSVMQFLGLYHFRQVYCCAYNKKHYVKSHAEAILW